MEVEAMMEAIVKAMMEAIVEAMMEAIVEAMMEAIVEATMEAAVVGAGVEETVEAEAAAVVAEIKALKYFLSKLYMYLLSQRKMNPKKHEPKNLKTIICMFCQPKTDHFHM